ncbi:lipopolysaccharide biosynthesis protein [Streptomyces sp. Ru87]|uniref:lipopolysaccharide biosynthesis protein n=1 Tax=Streptomyces sp. Ru87 TaxID=2044307 RepID=UPI000BF24D36|nr:lipopolysaccharide biosynthesis protein [Streptomyces sp. Ru87]PGH50647.1 lipopolysaccharide biosynthesis protein [Streptomyces sp. Ru87]
MTEQPGARTHEEPDLLRDQFRQLLRYRGLIAAGVAAGLLGGAWVGLAGGEEYVATSEVTVRSASVDPFAPGGSPEKEVSMGSEVQTALSSAVVTRAAEQLDLPGDTERMQQGLQVTNPPNTLVLRFSYTDASPANAAEVANAITDAYLDNRERQTESVIDNMVEGYENQLEPLREQRDELAEQISGLGEGRALDTTLSVQSSVIGRISELNNSITKLKALDTTPGFVVRKATPPQAPSGPGLSLLLGLGGAVGIGIGLLAAWVRLVFDPTARSESDVVRALRAPVLGTLPRRRRDAPARLLAEGRLAEEYRSVAFRLAYDQTFADRRRLLVVAPRGSIDTAAAVSVNLAASFVEMGREVLLVEADLRTPILAARLRSADGIRPGWARTPARGDNGWPTGLQIPIDAGESGAFDLIPGSRVRNVARALTSGPASRLISTADAADSVVVVLAPAVLSYADAIALADRVDGVLVVCDPREVRRDDLDRVRELVGGAGGTVLGALLHSEGAGDRPGFLGRRKKKRDRAAARRRAAEDAGSPAGGAAAATGTDDPAGRSGAAGGTAEGGGGTAGPPAAEVADEPPDTGPEQSADEDRDEDRDEAGESRREGKRRSKRRRRGHPGDDDSGTLTLRALDVSEAAADSASEPSRPHGR